jgi:hypothetical protein
MAANLQQEYKRKLCGRAREGDEKFGQHEVTMRVDFKMRRGGLRLRERGRGDPPCMLSKCHLHAREAHFQGGHTKREGGAPQERELGIEVVGTNFLVFDHLSRLQGGLPRCGSPSNLCFSYLLIAHEEGGCPSC